MIEVLRRPVDSALGPGIRVVDQLPGDRRASFAVAVPQRHAQRHHDQVGLLGRGDMPGHDPLGEDVDDEGDVDEPGPRTDVGEVGDPGPVGRCGEVPVQQVTGPLAVLGRDRGPHALVAAHPR